MVVCTMFATSAPCSPTLLNLLSTPAMLSTVLSVAFATASNPSAARAASSAERLCSSAANSAACALSMSPSALNFSASARSRPFSLVS
jgi:hypothetical protein